MLQVVVAGGEIKVVEVPEPVLRAGTALVRTSHSLISVGTESASLGGSGGRESLVMKAIRNPQLVRKVMDRVSSHGLWSTVELVRSRIGSEQAAGYSCAGIVIGVAPEVDDLCVGDRVACCGAGYANHAAVNCVPKNLVAKIPNGVSFEEAAFGTLGAIALQGVRRCAPTLGDRVVVLGLGLLGQLSVQLLRAHGAVPLGVDMLSARVERARRHGLSDGFAVGDRDFVQGILERTEGTGADAVIVTAADADPSLLNRCFDVTRKKGRVVLVGDVPIRIQRDKIYRKEIDFLISTSYGPGRYDPAYEEKGHDYPLPYVRWTEGRNLQEILRLIATGSLDVKVLIDGAYAVEKAGEAYASLAGERKPIGVLLDYHLGAPTSSAPGAPYVSRRSSQPLGAQGSFGVGVVGYGGYFRSMLLPLISSHPGFRLAAVCSRNPLTVRQAVEKDGFARGTTDYRDLVLDPEVQVVFVATRHDLHYPIARAAVEAGKAVFVEKPMTMTTEEGDELTRLVGDKGSLLTVGFNRRFSPHARRLKELLAPIRGPRTVVYRVNAGALPPEHWLLDPAEGGGRLVGEGVHFFDFVRFLVEGDPTSVLAVAPAGKVRDDGIISMNFPDGSVGVVVYTGAGSPEAGKERVEVFAGGMTFVLDDFRCLSVFGSKAPRTKTRAVEKGQREQLENFYRALCGQGNLGVTARDGLLATWCAETAQRAVTGRGEG